ncbi:hypothetical protein IQ247_25320 [Plectonema cf. radiosum LEGE 06105]|uniref:Uncharacterized protein n=1 Tax=Plectonema cf. radiosum LEGE 06105 TaxID=945769 RepID=A0A8J7F745_9CYAN|nr:hypothetical protein [Plectonema radiosum]MBE9215943.1 hypothetical protein [Plectonema cf. radiosum LEGE 06105]
MVVVSTQAELKEALVSKAEEIIVIDAELATNIGKFIERLQFENDREFQNRVHITGISLILGTALLSNLMAFGFLVGLKVLIVPEFLFLVAIVTALGMKLKNLLKNNYEVVKCDEEGLLLRYKLS